MNFVAALVCLIVALDSMEKATGSQTQHLFSPDVLWAWWFVAIAWFCNCLYFCFRMMFKGEK